MSAEEHCANPGCLGGANCPGHPWREDELPELAAIQAGSRDMNDAAYRGAGFAQARRFFRPQIDAKDRCEECHSTRATLVHEFDCPKVERGRRAQGEAADG